MKRRTLCLFALCALSVLFLAACGRLAAATMKLTRYEGSVRVADGGGKRIAPAEGLGLYGGYGVATEYAGHAWIDLDSVKLTKMDQNTEIKIAKEGKKLEIEVLSGNLFFNVTEPLAEDETLNIRTSSMLVGIRGTCGWVEAPDSDTLRVYLLEGSVTCTAGENTATITAGEMAALSSDGTIETQPFSAVPGFVWTEVRDDEALAQAILRAAGIDLTPSNPLSAYAEVLGNTSDVVHTEWIDFDGDGSEELLMIYVRDGSDGIRVYQNGPDGPRCVGGPGGNTHSAETYSVVESGGRLFVRRYSDTGYLDANGHAEYFDEYYGFVAQSDGTEVFGCADMCQGGVGGGIAAHGENGLVDFRNFRFEDSKDPTQLEKLWDEFHRRYAPVREILTWDGTSVTPAG